MGKIMRNEFKRGRDKEQMEAAAEMD